MGYFNINRILYNLRYIVKYFFFSLLVIAFIVICLLLSSNHCFASSVSPTPTPSVHVGYPRDNEGNSPIGSISDNLYNIAYTFWATTGTTDYFLLRLDLNINVIVLFDDENIGNLFYVHATDYSSNGLYWLQCTFQNSISTRYYLLNNDGTISYGGDFLHFGQGNNSYRIKGIYAGTRDVYYSASDGSIDIGHDFFNKTVDTTPTLSPPRFKNYDPIGNEKVDTLITGEISYFWFEIPRKQSYEPDGEMLDNYYPFSFYIHDVTELEPPENRYYNGTTSLFFNLNEQDSVNGIIFSKFLYDVNNSSLVEYAVPMVYPFGSYQNNHTYRLVLEWDYGEGLQSQVYEWTTNFTTAGAERQAQNANDPTLNNSTSLEDYVKNEYFNGSLISDYFNTTKSYIPILNSPIIRFFSDLFLDFYDAFTEISYKEITFDMPHSDTDIVYTSNFIYDNIPSALLIFIRSFYWFAISLYILKNIYSIYEEISSGDLFHSSTMKTDNIQTKFL